jgi:hypothetical protein
MEENGNAYRIFVEKPEGKRPVGRLRHRWEVNKVDLGETGWGSNDWIALAQERNQWRVLVNTVMNLHFPCYVGSSCATGGFSRMAQLHGVSCGSDQTTERTIV